MRSIKHEANAFLYLWNPKKWDWCDLQDAIYSVNNGDIYDMYWNCGNTKKIQIGDLFFLMRLGVQPKGIIGCGYVSSLPRPLTHWDDELAQAGKKCLQTSLLFKVLNEIPIVSLAELEQKYPDYKWAPQAGGLSIPQKIASDLLKRIQKNKNLRFEPVEIDNLKRYVEGKPSRVTSKSYDRSPAARQACVEHFGYDCSICGFSFEKTFGKIGARFIEVHHLKQIADIGKEYVINPKTDLRPVCANCHRMLHKSRPPLSIVELKKQLKK